MVLVLIDPVWQELLNKQIEDMNRYKMRMFASLSHELRTPLNCSISMLEFLESDIIHLANKTTPITPSTNIPNELQMLQQNQLPNFLEFSSKEEEFLSSNQDECIEKLLWPTNSNQVERIGQPKQTFDSINSPLLRLCGKKKNSLLNSSRESVQMTKVNSNLSDECERIIQSYLKPALHSSKLLLNLINDILDFVQIDSGKFKFTFVKFSLENLLQECIVLVNIQAKSKNIKLEIEFDTKIPPFIESDPNRIRQVLLNFLSNALKFTVKGHITVQARIMPDNPKQNLIILSVSDSGIGKAKAIKTPHLKDNHIFYQMIGISNKDIQNIFTAFNKVDLGHNQELNSQGCGLGLTISNSISKGLAPYKVGGIQVESQIGRGSTFSFLIENLASQNDQIKIESCEIHDTEDNEHDRKQNELTTFRSPNFDQLFEGGRFIIGQYQSQNSPMSSQQITNTLLPAPSFPIQIPSIESLHRTQKRSSLKTDSFLSSFNIRAGSTKDSRKLETILNEDGKCSCIQILAADDNEFNLFVIQQILRKSNLKADYACNGEIAFQKVNHFQIFFLKLH